MPTSKYRGSRPATLVRLELVSTQKSQTILTLLRAMSIQKIRLMTVLYFVVAVVLRLVPHGWNFTAVGALAMFAGCYLSPWQGMLVGLGAMGLSDFIGHYLELESMGFYDRSTMLAVYASFVLAGLIGGALRSRVNFWSVPAAAVAGSAIFFILTNFASWLDPQMGYAKTAAGLIECYIAAIPFAGNNLVGNLLFSGIFFGAYEALAANANRTATAQGQAN